MNADRHRLFRWRGPLPDFIKVPPKKSGDGLVVVGESVKRGVDHLYGVVWNYVSVAEPEYGTCAQRVEDEDEHKCPGEPVRDRQRVPFGVVDVVGFWLSARTEARGFLPTGGA